LTQKTNPRGSTWNPGKEIRFRDGLCAAQGNYSRENKMRKLRAELRRYSMLKATLCCVIIAATAAMADDPPLPCPWERLDNTPYLVGQGAHITYGITPGDNVGAIWGVFPRLDEQQQIDETKVAYFSPLSADWEHPDIGDWHYDLEEVPSVHALDHTGLTHSSGGRRFT
jgi:hypothetical protein